MPKLPGAHSMFSKKIEDWFTMCDSPLLRGDGTTNYGPVYRDQPHILADILNDVARDEYMKLVEPAKYLSVGEARKILMADGSTGVVELTGLPPIYLHQFVPIYRYPGPGEEQYCLPESERLPVPQFVEHAVRYACGVLLSREPYVKGVASVPVFRAAVIEMSRPRGDRLEAVSPYVRVTASCLFVREELFDKSRSLSATRSGPAGMVEAAPDS